MRRMVLTSALAAFLVGHSGCGGGVEEGLPEAAAPPKKFDMTDKFDKMKGSMKSKGANKISSGPPAPPPKS